MTDPIFGDCLTPIPGLRLRRLTLPGIEFEQLPHINDVLISHCHYDHLDAPTIAMLGGPGCNTDFWLPAGLGNWFRTRGIARYRELGWWKSAALDHKVKIHCVPAQHFAARGLFDRNRTHWCGWILRSGNRTIYFAGDTGYCPTFREIGERFGVIDLAMIPIGAYSPRWLMQSMHVDPFEAVKIHLDVRSRISVASHWGTFRLTDEPPTEPPLLLQAALREQNLSDKNFCVLSPGKSIII